MFSSSLKVDFFFFFNDTATTEIYTLSLHDALPISRRTPHAWSGGRGVDHRHPCMADRHESANRYAEPRSPPRHARLARSRRQTDLNSSAPGMAAASCPPRKPRSAWPRERACEDRAAWAEPVPACLRLGARRYASSSAGRRKSAALRQSNQKHSKTSPETCHPHRRQRLSSSNNQDCVSLRGPPCTEEQRTLVRLQPPHSFIRFRRM